MGSASSRWRRCQLIEERGKDRSRGAAPPGEKIGFAIAMAGCLAIACGAAVSPWRLNGNGSLDEVMRTTAPISAMIFGIVIGAALFSLVFRGLRGDDLVHDFLTNLPAGPAGAMITVLFPIFVIGFFLDLIEIMFLVVPIVAPILLLMGQYPVGGRVGERAGADSA